MKQAVLFGAARTDENSKEYQDAIKIGKILAQKDYILYNGGYWGMMGASTIGAISEKGIVHGIGCKTFGSQTGNPILTRFTLSNDIYDRLRELIDNKDVYIVMPGGVGTLSELFLTLDQLRKIKGKKPKVYLIGEHWNWIRECKLIAESTQKLITIILDVTTLELLL